MFPAQPPDARRSPLVARVRGQSSASPGSRRLVSDFCSSARGFCSPLLSAPTSRPDRLPGFFAFRFARGRCDQLPPGLSPVHHLHAGHTTGRSAAAVSRFGRSAQCGRTRQPPVVWGPTMERREQPGSGPGSRSLAGSGSPGPSPAQGPHGSGRAELPHPALQAGLSLRAPSFGVRSGYRSSIRLIPRHPILALSLRRSSHRFHVLRTSL